ncbi:MAG: hypothetical protein KJN60_07310 [Boseongicola sp.]|nr:hypothetical protein [Boseongicola sp.]
MAWARFAILALLGISAAPASADCVAADISGISLSYGAEPPEPPDLELRPKLPNCLRDLSRPEQENCPREELARYSKEVDEWIAELNDYATATDRFANEVARFANSAIQQAHRARDFADLVHEFRSCEVSAILSASGD